MIEVKVPELAESIVEGTISEWLKKEGDYVEAGEAIIELETDKINLEVTCEHQGVLKEIYKKPGDVVKVGEVIAALGDADEANSKGKQEPKDEQDKESPNDEQKEKNKTETKLDEKETTEAEDGNDAPIASPAARKKARELGINLSDVPFHDPLGRVRLDDVKHTYERQQKNGDQSTKESVSRSENENEEKEENNENIEVIKMSRRRQTIANRLVEAQQTAAMLTTFNEVDMTAIMNLRDRHKEQFYKKHEVKIGFMSFFTKAVIGALKEFPLLNAEIKGNDIIVKKFYDIGVAVSTDDGLVVPVIRKADHLSFANIEKQIMTLSEKARSKTLKLQDLTDGTFTITNGGVFGSLYSTPILNAPQVGILGMHKIQKRPVVIDDTDAVEVRPMMYLALSYDHRIIDGKEAVQFLVKLKELLEDPENLLLEG